VKGTVSEQKREIWKPVVATRHVCRRMTLIWRLAPPLRAITSDYYGTTTAGGGRGGGKAIDTFSEINSVAVSSIARRFPFNRLDHSSHFDDFDRPSAVHLAMRALSDRSIPRVRDRVFFWRLTSNGYIRVAKMCRLPKRCIYVREEVAEVAKQWSPVRSPVDLNLRNSKLNVKRVFQDVRLFYQ